ncbi:nitrate reductase associated protein [Leptolyngbya sp. FACHB-17]|uniref:nitrate reductase associated protein n=1 Tax=unclassified Leptolyngbya TaxID=2650499 RepID=UPI00168026DF|nr:nitrate reductase associated protein [Leptolyngbya sp. FACHB-17]MBD2081055.1 nitrate reductase associated protein [Leptolyngbya sp. FACHB-17]
MSPFFQFESDFVDSLRCIPMIVRYKLDTCGVKLKLHQWNKFSESDRQQTVDAPCSTEDEVRKYKELLHQLIEQRTGETATDLAIDENPSWNDVVNIPESVIQQAERVGVRITPKQWQTLTPIQRFVLIKLSRSSHENANFLPAVKEFQLIPA